MGTEIQKYDEIIENYISFATKFMERDYKRMSEYCIALSDPEIRVARMGLSVDEVGEKYTDEQKKKGCQLHEAARNGDHVLALQLLKSDPNLMFYSVDGNTVLHVMAMRGNRSFVKKLIKFIRENTLVFASKKCPYITFNEDEDTALHLALKFKHEELASDLTKELPEPKFVYAMNKNRKMPIMLAIRAGYSNLVEQMLKQAPWTSISPEIREYLPHSTILHDAMDTKNLGMLQIILDNMPVLAESISDGWTPLTYAVNKGYVEAVQYFLNKFPNSVAKCTYEGIFPIHATIMVDNIDIVKEILSHYPEAMNQVFTNRNMVGGWRTLSFATYMGRLSIVRFMLTNFPEYAFKCESDGDFPIHWTFGLLSDESVLKEFISCVPETLYQVTKRDETILHLVVRYTRPEYLSYLKTLPDLYKIFHNKDVDGNTFLDLIKQKMKKYYKSHPEAPKTIFSRMKEGLGRKFKFLV